MLPSPSYHNPKVFILNSQRKFMDKQRIHRVRTAMDFTHLDRKLKAAYPFYGPANSKTLLEKIRSDSLKEPTSGQVVSFVHEYFKGEEPESQELTRIMRDRHFKAFTGILYDPKTQLAYFIDNPEFNERSIVDKGNLIKRLNESYAQVPFEHIKIGPIERKKIAKHPYIIAFAHGEEGAEKTTELVSKNTVKEAFLWVPNVSNLRKPEARIAALNSYCGGGLFVGGDRGDLCGGCAFGLFPTNINKSQKA